ncbi:MAG: spermidine/putrescine ABC transporter substrate-binding protein [Deltaproteobacteria bacterium]|jgi:spermidine/putrescine transport system substrate-binding protein|nr:spermidine/putrescine ABC transporter substrate-binding protein [Deltaproteobacteria bacterium]
MRIRLLSLVLSLALFLLLGLSSLAGDLLAQDKKTLTIFIWSEYMDPDLIVEFEKRFDVRVRLDYYESNEEMIAKLQTVRQGVYDIIVPSTYFVPTLTNLDLIQPLDHSLLPNLGNIAPDFARLDVDPGNQYTVPYQWGTSGMAVHSANIAAVDPSWELLFTPSPELGNFLLFDTARDALGSALKFLGYSSNTMDLDEIAAAGKLLTDTKNRPTFMGFDSGVGGLSKVMGGVASIAQVYSGEAIKASKEDPELHYVIPREGCEIWLDLLAIPKNAPNVDVAHQFLNFILEPEPAARLASFNNYATPNQAALEFISDEDKNNPGMYPPPELRQNMEYMLDLGEANRYYDETWTLVKSR